MSKRYASVDRSKEIKSKKELDSFFPRRNLVLNVNDFDIRNIIHAKKYNELRTLNPQRFKPKKLPIITKQITSSQSCDINSKTSDLSTEVNNAFINEKENNEMNYILKTDANYDNNNDNYYKVIIHSDFRDKTTVNNSRLNSVNKIIRQKINIPIKSLIKEEKKKIKYPPILRSERLYPKMNQDKNRINILKKIKSIRNRNLKIKNENRNLLIPTKFNDNIAYESKFENYVLDASVLLKKHNENNDFKESDNIKTFVSKNKELCVNNLLINILKRENKNLKENFEIRNKNVENFVNTLSKDKKDFESYINEQKKLYYQTNDLLNEIHTKNYILYKLHYDLKSSSKILEDEIFKMIEQIESLRVFAKFVTKVLGGNEKLFDGELIPNYENTTKPDINILIKGIFEKYGNLLTNRKLSVTKNSNNTNNEIEKENNNNTDNNNSNDDEISEEVDIDILNDPHFMVWKFKDIEDKILRSIEKNDIYNKYANKEYENNEKVIKELKNRIIKLKEELEFSEKNLSDFKNIIQGKNFQENKNKMYYGLIKDLCKNIYDMDNEYKNKNRNQNLDLFELNDDISHCMNLLVKKEEEINNYIDNLEFYEKTDKKLFTQIMNERKEDLKFLNQHKNKENLNSGDNEKAQKLYEKFYKIIIKSKKSEPPYYKLKKEVVIKEDKSEIINRENSELITYK